jgi:hypothetical protein
MPLGTWLAADLPSTREWNGVAYGNGRFVAISEDLTSNSAYSSDGITWTASALPAGKYWKSITFGNGLFVVIAGTSYDGQAVATSPDGITWTSRTLRDAGWMSIIYGGGVFAAVANGSDPAYSSDGITWTTKAMAEIQFGHGPNIGSYQSLAYGNGGFLAYDGVNERVAHSTDGINWYQSVINGAIAAGGQGHSIAYGAGLFVGPSYQIGKMATSSDGEVWTQRSTPNSTYYASVVYADTRFVAISGTLVSDAAAVSTDGVTWESEELPFAAHWSSITYGAGKYVVVARGSDQAACMQVNLPHIKVSTITDTFPNSSLDTKWINTQNSSVSAGKLNSVVSVHDSFIATDRNLDFTDSSLSVKVDVSELQGAEAGAQMRIDTVQGNTLKHIMLYYVHDSLRLYKDNAFVGLIPYNATAHAYWRITSSGTTITAATSPDDSTWTDKFAATYSGSLDSVRIQLRALHAGTGSGTVYFSNLNI